MNGRDRPAGAPAGAIPACPSCQTAVDAAARFCPTCGALQAAGPAAAETLWEAGERRHLAVLFCDLVGSTELATRIDPEDFGQLLEHLQDGCAAAIAAHAGYVAQYLGDGVVAYFGYPTARENPVADAVRAACRIHAAVAAVAGPESTRLAVRIGIAHGLVVVGAVASRDGRANVVGDTPNLAARLQAIAPPGGTVLSEPACRRIAGVCATRAYGVHALKGFDAPVRAHLVVSATADAGDAPVGAAALPFVGRDGERAALDRALRDAAAGRGRVVAVTGEPGVGKSRLVATFCGGLPADASLRCIRASERHQNSPLYPVLRWLESAAAVGSEAAGPAVRHRLQPFLAGVLPADAAADAYELLGEVLDLDPPQARTGHLTSAQRRERTLDLLVRLVVDADRAGPVVILVEDAHWLDPTSRAWLHALGGRIPERAAMVLVTTRDVGAAPDGAERLDLGPLAAADARQLIAGLIPSDAATEAVLARAEGIPFYLEAFARTLANHGAGGAGGDAAAGTIPSSLQDLVLARLDAVPAARRVAQAGSVLGRTFSAGVLAAVMRERRSTVEAALAELERARLLVSAGDGTWAFPHALIREAAYEVLLKRVRQRLHARVAEILIAGTELGTAAREPETVAHHLTYGGAPAQAAGYWRAAGERALAKAAYAEAVHHLRGGLACLAAADTSDAVLELHLQAALGTALTQLHGFAAEAVEAAFARAEALCDAHTHLPDAERFHVLWGVWALRITRGEIPAARALAARLGALAERLDDPDLRVLADAAAVPSAYYAGDHRAALAACDAVLARYAPARHARQALTYTIDAKLLAVMFGALAAWACGDAGRHARLDAAIEDQLTALQMPFLVPYARCMQAMQRVLAGRSADAGPLIDRAEAVAGDLALGFWQVAARLWRGAAMILDGDARTGVAVLETALKTYEAIGAVTVTPYLRAVLARGYAMLGADAAAAAMGAEARAAIAERGELCHEAEIRALLAHAGVGAQGR